MPVIVESGFYNTKGIIHDLVLPPTSVLNSIDLHPAPFPRKKNCVFLSCYVLYMWLPCDWTHVQAHIYNMCVSGWPRLFESAVSKWRWPAWPVASYEPDIGKWEWGSEGKCLVAKILYCSSCNFVFNTRSYLTIGGLNISWFEAGVQISVQI